jgi:lipopolysaccharide transport system permease protein
VGHDRARVALSVKASAPAAELRETVIEPSGGVTSRDLTDFWQYRELLWFLIWRDIKVRYKQTVLGAVWALIQPLATTVVFSLSFGRMVNMSSDGLPYPLFALAGLVPWNYFAAAVNAGSSALIGNQQLISKVYFPRIIIPLAAVLTPLVDFAIGLALLVAALFWFGIVPSPHMLWIAIFMLLAVATAAAVSLWVSALSVQYRDIRYALPFIIQFGLFASPVAYPTSAIAPGWRGVFALNPLTGVIEGFRSALVGAPTVTSTVWLSGVAVVVLFVGGLVYFFRVQGTLADQI